ncbi:MAG: hypothetical protein M1826_005937 [Phylliscum demangeonii]|nr:MAG: hypothetical protein M1826_005937 [Phylliscum demangeonii]
MAARWSLPTSLRLTLRRHGRAWYESEADDDKQARGVQPARPWQHGGGRRQAGERQAPRVSHNEDNRVFEEMWKIAQEERNKEVDPGFSECFGKEMTKQLGPEWHKNLGPLENRMIWNAVVDFCGGLQSMKLVVPAIDVSATTGATPPKPQTDRPALNPSSQPAIDVPHRRVDDDNNNNTPNQFRRVTGLLNSASRFAKHDHHILRAWPAVARSFSPQRLEGSMMRLLRTEAL